MAPYVNIQAGQQTASIGNPALQATTALAYDLMFERYFRSVGFLSGGLFYKRLTNFIFPISRARLAAEELGPDATQVIQPVNGPSASLAGFEVAWQQNLTFLPGLLSGLGVNANYTYTRSDATIPGLGRDGVTTPLPGQTGNAGNVGLFYDRGPLSLRVGGNYSGQFLSTINPQTSDGDTRTLARFQVDASGSFNMGRGITLFGEFINLTNTPLRATVGDRLNRGGGGDDPSYEFYRPWGMVGLKIQRQ
jgi:TonB-dependent receptor